ncbi:MAG TPA: post-COAP-1 domain-containing protein [Candidatus Limnocylindrales bacterium]|nr:post-COAP-1 domain-containing protein [Candidatus Limnocylindrales bacterium]
MMRSLARPLGAAALLLAMLLVQVPTAAGHDAADPLDPAHNVALPCEALATPGLVPRSARDISHVANVCGFVGTDVEFQSRMAADGLHDYAFVGTMGAGMRIFDISDPAHPTLAGAYTDPGWQNDVQVRGDTAIIAFDPVGLAVHASACLRSKSPTSTRGGVDIVRLAFDPATATFSTSLVGCYLNAVSGGAHNSTLHPSGEWLAVATSASGIEVVDLRGAQPTFVRKLAAGPDTAVGSAHDVSFSADGRTMYVASPDSGTYIADVSNVLTAGARRIGFIPENTEPGGSANPRNVVTSHQADTSSDGTILAYTDERGGGLSNTGCNTAPDGIIGGMHYWALAPIDGLVSTADASPATPRRLGSWFYPDPGLLADPLEPVLAGVGRTERACTIHVFRNGGNGTAGPGEIAAGYGGLSDLPARRAVSAHYGAGVWWLDFSSAPTSSDGTPEHPQTDWGNTLGWNVMPGADTWSAKEYKGYVYAGDMTRGFDVYAFTDCVDAGCIVRPSNTPGRVHGGGKLEGELAEFTILRGTAVGGTGQFSLDVSYTTGAASPLGSLSYRDKPAGKRVEATAIDSLTIAGSKATLTGRATVDGTPGMAFFVEVEDLGGKDSPDSFRIVLGDGYGAAGVLTKGNLTVEGGLLGLLDGGHAFVAL